MDETKSLQTLALTSRVRHKTSCAPILILLLIYPGVTVYLASQEVWHPHNFHISLMSKEFWCPLPKLQCNNILGILTYPYQISYAARILVPQKGGCPKL